MDELFSAYTQYAKSKGLRLELVTSEEGHIVATISGKGAGEAFQHEAGKHCVQRIPNNDRKGRKQTSIVVVGVLPMRPQHQYKYLPDSEIETTTQGGHGPGGQHQNATDSAVRMRHLPTGISVFINGRSQNENKRLARDILTMRVNDFRHAAVDDAYREIRNAQLGDSGRADKDRTYNFINSRVTDHRLGTKTSNIKAVMRGDFEILFPKDE